MVNETSDRPRLTAKGARTRARIVEEAAALIHERGVTGTTLEDVKVAAEVSGSQMYHYFPDKDELVQAVIDYHADAIVSRNRQALGGANGVEAWRKMVIAAARRTKAKGGLRTWLAGRSTRRERPRGPSAHRVRVRSVGSRHWRWTAIPSCRRETPVRH
jgi:TetR/AcrR family transcriptional regulator, transcriptional repressor for nem operon